MRIVVLFIFVIIFLASLSAQNIFAQIDSICYDDSNLVLLTLYHMFLSYSLYPDWILRDIHQDCGAALYDFELPKYSSDTSKYFVTIGRTEYTNEEFNTNRQDILDNTVSRLQSTEIFKTIDEKFENKRIWLHHWFNWELYEIAANNESIKNDSYFLLAVMEDGTTVSYSNKKDSKFSIIDGLKDDGTLQESEKSPVKKQETPVLTALEFYLIIVISGVFLWLMIWKIKKLQKSEEKKLSKVKSRWIKPELYLTTLGIYFLVPSSIILFFLMYILSEARWFEQPNLGAIGTAIFLLGVPSILPIVSAILIFARKRIAKILSLISLISHSALFVIITVSFNYSFVTENYFIWNFENLFLLVMTAILLVINGIMYMLFVKGWKQTVSQSLGRI